MTHENICPREAAASDQEPIGKIPLEDVIDIHLSLEHRNTITLIRNGQDKLQLKVRNGETHNWLGNIRERIFCAKEGEADFPILRKKKRKSVRSMSKTYEEEMTLLQKQSRNRCSRSTNDLSQILSLRSGTLDTHERDSADCSLNRLSTASSLRSRNTSVSSSSQFSGSSNSSSGSLSHFIRKPRIPVSGFTGRAFLANENRMVSQAGVVTNEDFEYLVQAERTAERQNDLLLDDQKEPIQEGKKDGMIRNVRFNSEQDIYVIENGISIIDKDSKESNDEQSKGSNRNECDSKDGISSRRRTGSFVWGRIKIGKRQSSQKLSSDYNSIEKEKIEVEQENANDKSHKKETDECCDILEANMMLSEERHERIAYDKEDKIQLRNEFSRQNSSPSVDTIETSFVRPRFYTESRRRTKESTQDAQSRTRSDNGFGDFRASITSINSRDSLISVTSSGMKERIFYWKRSSSRSLRSVTISNPVSPDATKRDVIANDVNSQIDKIANERLEEVFKNGQLFFNEQMIPSQIPKKPLKFHTIQLKKVLKGILNPPGCQTSVSEVQLMLDSMLVMLSLSQDPDNQSSSDYDIPRHIKV